MRLITLNGEAVEFKSELKEVSRPERVKRALKFFSIFILLAIASLPIIVAHFVLVPTFIILAFYMSYKCLKNKFEIDLSGVNCPKCQTDLKRKKIYFDSEDFKVRCYNCQSSLELQK